MLFVFTSKKKLRRSWRLMRIQRQFHARGAKRSSNPAARSIIIARDVFRIQRNIRQNMKNYKRFLPRKNIISSIFHTQVQIDKNLGAPCMTILFALIAKAIGFNGFNDTAKNTPYTFVYFAPFSKATNVCFVFAW
jgi:hypothetical protein